MIETQQRIGAVVLTYNSSEDLLNCLIGLRAQQGVNLQIIVVDNASKPDERSRLKAIFLEVLPMGIILPANGTMDVDASAVFLCNDINSGYSAGNNIGARFAVASGCEAVLIINPDARIEDPDYLVELFGLITVNTKTAVACSALTNLLGIHENPMIEPGFWEEFFWPLQMIIKRFFYRQIIRKPSFNKPQRVEKVSGACFLIRTDFLLQIDYFDETVFLYCEEAILSAQVQRAGWNMMMDPRQHALHSHSHSSMAEGKQYNRYMNWAKSRGKFHATYSQYGVLRQAFLAESRRTILVLIWLKMILKKLFKAVVKFL
jgi:hypothetical protein